MYKRSAIISDCQKYRYCLTRVWDDEKPRVLFIMFNPSTADVNNDDPTIRRCIGFAKSWGFGGLYVVNLFAFRSTNPKELLEIIDPVGSENKRWIRTMSTAAQLVVCAWGNTKLIVKLQKVLWPNYNPLKWIDKPLHYLELSIDNTPKHPLYLSKDCKPIPINNSSAITINSFHQKTNNNVPQN